jgi:hypothetical protein
MPKTTYLSWALDILATRYGWTKKYIFESLYWEEFNEILEVAANNLVYEKNEERFFNFLLHAGSKDAVKSWKDSQLPFPDKDSIGKKKTAHYGGLDQMPRHVPIKKVKRKNNG